MRGAEDSLGPLILVFLSTVQKARRDKLSGIYRYGQKHCCSEQVWKGGCWYNSAQYCRSGYRRTLATYNNYTYDYSRGFRMWAPYSPIME